MKKLLITTVISVGVLSFNASSAIDSQKSFKFIGDTQYAGICKAALTDNVSLFKKNVKQQLSWLNASRTESHEILLNQDNFQCAGMGVLEFAETHGSQKLVDYLSPKKAEAVPLKKFSFIGDTQYAGICKAALTDNVSLFKKNVKQQLSWLNASRTESHEILLNQDNFQCAGMGVLEFAETHGSQKLVDYLSPKKAEAVPLKKFSFIGDMRFAGFCEAAITNNVKLFKREVRTQIGSLASSDKAVLDIILDARYVQCAGLGISEFSEKRNATDIVEFISNKRA